MSWWIRWSLRYIFGFYFYYEGHRCMRAQGGVVCSRVEPWPIFHLSDLLTLRNIPVRTPPHGPSSCSPEIFAVKKRSRDYFVENVGPSGYGWTSLNYYWKNRLIKSLGRIKLHSPLDICYTACQNRSASTIYWNPLVESHHRKGLVS